MPPGSGRGRRPTRPRLTDGSPQPGSLKDLAAETPLRKVTWREGTKGKLAGRFAWLRVWPGQSRATGECAGAEPIWLLIDEQAHGKIRFAFSNLPAHTRRITAVRLWKNRWPVQQVDQQMKEELGLDHFESRSWRGFYHHACLVMLGYGFLVLEQQRARKHSAQPGKKGWVLRYNNSHRRFQLKCDQEKLGWQKSLNQRCGHRFPGDLGQLGGQGKAKRGCFRRLSSCLLSGTVFEAIWHTACARLDRRSGSLARLGGAFSPFFGPRLQSLITPAYVVLNRFVYLLPVVGPWTVPFIVEETAPITGQLNMRCEGFEEFSLHLLTRRSRVA